MVFEFGKASVLCRADAASPFLRAPTPVIVLRASCLLEEFEARTGWKQRLQRFLEATHSNSTSGTQHVIR